ncbi:MAG TPA: hypothetical protein VHJ39_04970 [Solirubrobacteraceae bacterium]|jgi:hypothetical protein|nr:hypothetical protein [Solirubrobacteraceae bacterium]
MSSRPPDLRSYSYLVGMYLWDGYVAKARRTFQQEFLRGLLHSDVCRTVNRFSTRLPSGRVAEYAYRRWLFSNRSTDIRALLCEYCDRLGIRCTQSNPRNISVSHRTSIALLDSFVPAKS